jgi:hypothetical protein
LFVFFDLDGITQCFSTGQGQFKRRGKDQTYELINNSLSPGHGAVEASDQCASHPDFGRHIAEKWDASLNK